MTEEKASYVDDDFAEERRRWEGIHGDEAAQSRLPFESTSRKAQENEQTSPSAWLFCGLGCLAGTAVLCYGLYKLILVLF